MDEIAVALRRAGVDAEVDTPEILGAYAVAGIEPTVVVRPREEAAVIVAIAAARERGWVVVVRGGGTCDTWGGPVEGGPVLVLDLRLLAGVVGFDPGDLTARVLPGTPLAALNRRLRDSGQTLAWAPPGADRATVGGVVAADAWGPVRLGNGAPRDVVLGLRCVDGAARLFATGGHVVKNVSGLDVGKLMVGSFGTLAALTEVSVKLRPLPAAQAVWGVRFPAAAAPAAYGLARAVLDGGLAPTGLTLVEDAAAATLAVAFEGGGDEVAEQVVRVAGLAGAAETLGPEAAGEAWARGTEPTAAGAAAVVVRCDVPDGALPALAAQVGAMAHAIRRTAWPGTGALWCTLEGAAAATIGSHGALDLVRRLREAAEAAGGRAVVAACPAAVRVEAQPFGDPGGLLPWFRSLKRRFDPDGILAPGRFAGRL